MDIVKIVKILRQNISNTSSTFRWSSFVTWSSFFSSLLLWDRKSKRILSQRDVFLFICSSYRIEFRHASYVRSMKVEYQQKFFRISLQRSATIAISDHLVRRGEINNRNINRIKHRVPSAALRNFHSGFFFPCEQSVWFLSDENITSDPPRLEARRGRMIQIYSI